MSKEPPPTPKVIVGRATSVSLAALAAGGPKVAFGPRVPERWICLFEGRAGARARAVFAIEDQAKQFAEQHAQVTATGMPLKWNDTSDPMVLATPVGEYRITRTHED